MQYYHDYIRQVSLADGAMPVILPNDRLAHLYGIKACVGHLPGKLRAVHIRDTLSVQEFYISEGLAETVGVCMEPWCMPVFDAQGTFLRYETVE